MKTNETMRRLKWWIAAFVVFVIIIAVAVIQNARQQVNTARKSSAYSISRSEAARITASATSMIKDCGTWGITDRVTAENASEIYNEARMYSLDAQRMGDAHAGYILSRHDKRNQCLSQYVSQDSAMQGFTPDWSDRDAMMAFSVDSDSIDVSSPRNSKVSMNGNSKPMLTVKASWKYSEQGLYPLFRHAGDNPKSEYDVSINSKTAWKTFRADHEMNGILIDMELNDGKWDVLKIHGGNWKDYGYGNVLADSVSYSDGAKRVQTPWEDGSERP